MPAHTVTLSPPHTHTDTCPGHSCTRHPNTDSPLCPVVRASCAESVSTRDLGCPQVPAEPRYPHEALGLEPPFCLEAHGPLVPVLVAWHGMHQGVVEF